jgi:hypothetical protein
MRAGVFEMAKHKSILRIYLLQIIALFCVSHDCRACAQLDEDEMIARVKRLDVNKLDSRLPKEEFAKWLLGILGPRSKISWEMNDCGEQSGGRQDADRDIPACVQVEATVAADWNVVVMIQVGTVKNGPLTTPVVKDAFIQRGDQSFTAHSLGELVELLKKATGRK